jgi:hypothetical protein
MTLSQHMPKEAEIYYDKAKIGIVRISQGCNLEYLRVTDY